MSNFINTEYKKGDKVKVYPMDGPLPAGIPYQGYETTIRMVIPHTGMVSVQGCNGKEFAVVYIHELERGIG